MSPQPRKQHNWPQRDRNGRTSADNVVLIPGTSSRGHLAENLAAGSLSLQDDEVTRLTTAFGTP
jgi:aryl-alcohol dehydrogenase-like predicted oxidoreductase